MLRIAMALLLVASLAACNTAMDALAPGQEPELSTLSYGSGTIVTENDLGVEWFENLVGGNSGLSFVSTYASPPTADLGAGALVLVTEADNAARSELSKPVDVPLADVGSLSYWTYQPAGNPGVAAVAYKLYVTFPEGGWTFLIYEPYWQNATGDPAPVVGETWQEWMNMEGGNWWSSRTSGGLAAGFGGPPFYTLADVLALQPDAVVQGITVGIGSYNPDWMVLADGVTFAGTTYNFEPYVEPPAPATIDDCKRGGWEAYGFKNQGQCIASVVANENSVH